MSDYRVLIIVLFFSSVYCDDCVTFDFEKDFNSSFNNEGVCDGMATWNVGFYENLPIDSPHADSSKFVYPHEKLSCSSSFTFQMAASGVLEVNLFMSPTLDTDQVMIMAKQILPDANNAVVGLAWILASEENFISGWRTVKIPLSGFGTFSGFITLFGMKSPGSIVLIDSFRYVGPSIDKDSCVIYDETITTTTTSQLPTKETPITTPKNPKTTTTETSKSTMTTPDEFPTTTTTETSTTTTKIPTTITTETSTTTKIIPTTTPQETTITTPENPKTTTAETSISTSTMTTPDEFPPTTTTETSTTSTKIPTTTPKETTTTTKEIPTTKPNVAPTTTENPNKTTTETLKTTTTTTPKETSTTSTEIQTTKSTETPTTSVPSLSTSTERPRLSVSILLIKIQKFFK